MTLDRTQPHGTAPPPQSSQIPCDTEVSVVLRRLEVGVSDFCVVYHLTQTTEALTISVHNPHCHYIHPAFHSLTLILNVLEI